MKKFLAPLIALSLMLSGCADPMTVNNETYESYGPLNEGANKSDKVCYRVVAGNVVWSIILIETIIAPIYFLGFSIMEPYKLKNPDGTCSK